MAEQLELADMCVALDRLLAVLREARDGGGALSPQHREALLEAYAPLCDLVPGVFELDAERNRREPIIVHSLLRQVAGIEKVAIDKLGAANLLSVSALADASVDEVVAVTGLSTDLAGRVVARFCAYRSQAGAVAAPDPAAELRALGELALHLREQNRAYDAVASGWSAEQKERKRELRRERAETLLRVHVSLARLGQVDRLVELDRLSFRRKVEYIEATVRAARTGVMAEQAARPG